MDLMECGGRDCAPISLWHVGSKPRRLDFWVKEIYCHVNNFRNFRFAVYSRDPGNKIVN